MNRRKFFGLIATAPLAVATIEPKKVDRKWATNLEIFNQQMQITASKLPQRKSKMEAFLRKNR